MPPSGTMLVSLTAHGKPVAFARPRFNGRRGFNAPEYAEGKRALSRLLERAMRGRTPVIGPVAVDLVFCVGPIPKTHKRKKLTDKLRELCGLGAFLAGSDIDNYEKAVLDACNGIVWDDDVQVVEVCKKKIHGGEEWTLITVREMG